MSRMWDKFTVNVLVTVLISEEKGQGELQLQSS